VNVFEVLWFGPSVRSKRDYVCGLTTQSPSTLQQGENMFCELGFRIAVTCDSFLVHNVASIFHMLGCSYCCFCLTTFGSYRALVLFICLFLSLPLIFSFGIICVVVQDMGFSLFD
jgi:hypothetical protein